MCDHKQVSSCKLTIIELKFKDGLFASKIRHRLLLYYLSKRNCTASIAQYAEVFIELIERKLTNIRGCKFMQN